MRGPVANRGRGGATAHPSAGHRRRSPPILLLRREMPPELLGSPSSHKAGLRVIVPVGTTWEVAGNAETRSVLTLGHKMTLDYKFI